MTTDAPDENSTKIKPAEALEFGNILRRVRQSLDLTLDAMSRLTKLVDPAGTGISRVALSRYENGDSLPGLRELKVISHSTRMPLSFLVYGYANDPMNFLDEPLELIVEDFVSGIVNATLRHHGLIPQDDPENIRLTKQYEALLERARSGE